MINHKTIDDAFEFYNIDNKYKDNCYECAKQVNEDINFSKSFNKVFKILYCQEFKHIKKLWNIHDINELFINNVNPFITNLMILIGYKIHLKNMSKYKLDESQIIIHKNRVKECFERDLENRDYRGIRISQMLWAIYFIRLKIIEIGRLQYELSMENNNKNIINIHIPRGKELNLSDVKKSIKDSRILVREKFNINNPIYICNSWLLSNQVHEFLDKDKNIYRFYELFDVNDGEDCIPDILDFVYDIDKCDNYCFLPEKTTLQKRIKEQLLNGKVFYMGLGVLK